MVNRVKSTSEDADIAEEVFPSMYQAMIQGAELAGEPLRWHPDKDAKGQIHGHTKKGEYKGTIYEE